MLINDLESLGLTKNEAMTYLALHASGKAKAGALIQQTSLHRNLVYQALESLIGKHLVTKTTTGSVAQFQVTDAVHLLDGIREQEFTAQKIIETLKEQRKINDQEITIYEGADGLRAFCFTIAESLGKNGVLHVLGSGGRKFEKAMGERALKKYYSLIAKNGSVRVLMYQAQQYTDQMHRLAAETKKFSFRTLPYDMTPSVGIVFTDRSVSFLLYEEPITVIEIANPHLVEVYRQHFDMLWNLQVRIEEGIDAIKRGFMSIVHELAPGDEYYSIGTLIGQSDTDLDAFFLSYHRERIAKGVACKLLSYTGDTEKIRSRYHAAGDPEERISFVQPLRGTPTGFMQTMLYNDKVFIPIYGERPMAMFFENAQLYQGFKQHFDELWDRQTHTLRGDAGIVELCEAVLQEGHDLYLIAATGRILHTHSTYYPSFTARREARGITLHMLANASSRGQDFTRLPQSTIAYLPPEFESPMVVWVFGSYVAHVLWQEAPLVYLTRDPKIADSYRQYFSALQKIATP